MANRKAHQKSRRRGVLLSMELVIALPILLVVILAAVEFSFLLLASQAITAAANVATRQATLPSATSAQVDDAVMTALASWRWAQGNEVRVRIYVDRNNGEIEPSELVYDSDNLPDDDNVLASAPTGTVVQVTIDLPSVAASPDMLGFIPALSIRDQELTASFVGRKE